MSNTPIWGLPEIAENQGDKYITHNEALNQMEGIRRTLSTVISTPPGTPAEGDSYILTGTPPFVGDWSTFTKNSIAHYKGGIWLEYIPKDGWTSFCVGDMIEHWYSLTDDAWYMYGTQISANTMGIIGGAANQNLALTNGAVATDVTGYGDSGSVGVVVDPVLGTITVPDDGFYAFGYFFNFTEDGNAKDFGATLLMDVNGLDITIGSAFIATNSSDEIVFSGGFTRSATQGDVIKLKVSAFAKNITISINATSLELERKI